MIDVTNLTSSSFATVVPDDSEAAIVIGAAWMTGVAALVTLANIRRWRRVLRDARRRGVEVPVDGRRSFARRVAEWSLAASVLLGACSTPDDTPGVEHLGPAIDPTTASASPDDFVEPSEVTARTSTTEPATPIAPTSSSTSTPPTSEPEVVEEIATPTTEAESDAVPSATGSASWEPTADLPTAHVVQPGDHLWGIAEATVRRVLGPDTTGETVAAYWVELLAENQSLLRSGDPDLIHPGEAILLPPISVLTD